MPTQKPVADMWPPPFLIPAARGLVGISQATLAKHVKVTRKTIVALENDESTMMDYRRVKVLEAAAEVLEKRYGVEFTKAAGGRGEGVRLARPRRS
jgi:DNA-binding XRE family transcriptional regulator